MNLRLASLILATVLVAAACSADDSATVTSSLPSGTPAPEASTVPPATAAAPTESTTTIEVAPGLTDAELASIGDPYYPELGNSGYDALHYTLDLDVDPGANQLDGIVTIEAVATANLSRFHLDLHELSVASVFVDGTEATFTRSDNELIITPATPVPTGEDMTVSVEYSGSPQPFMTEALPFPMGWRVGGTGIFVVSEPDGSRSWYPVNDHPLDKATYTFRVTVPPPYVVAANGTLTETLTADGGTTFVFEHPHPMASYLATINIGEFERQEEEGPGGLLIRNYFPVELAEPLQRSFAVTSRMVEFLEERFGPYPFEVYGVVVVDGFEAALENQTLSVFGIGLAQAPFVDRVIVHELAHQWFGDSVSPATWQDIWLNEGFATYAEWLWVEETLGLEALLPEIEGIHAFYSTSEHEPPGSPAPDDLFDSTVYVRGGLTLWALRSEVGEEVLFDIFRTYLDRFAYGNASTDDFIEVANEVAGRDVGGLIRMWTYEDLPPLP